jgi:twinkle protein
MNKPIKLSTEGVDEQEMKDAFERLAGPGNLYLYDHFGSINSDHLLDRIRYMSKGLGVNWIILDHLSIVVSGDDSIGDERRAIDVAMTKLRCLVEETKIGLILVSHLKRPEGKGHEEGAKTSLAQLRGSAAIAQLSDMVLGLERNQQDPENKDQTSIRVLKNRFSGETGTATTLVYNKETGRLLEGEFSAVEEGEEDEF